jgi:putative acetyltransferase
MLLIRHEMPEDAPEVRSLLIQAFNRPDEADVVEALRSRGAISLALVALVERQVVGHILFSPVTIGAKSSNLKAIGLAPLAVLPDYQGQGIGSQLVQQGLSECRKAGYQIVVVLGEPAFYQPFTSVLAFRRLLGLEFAMRMFPKHSSCSRNYNLVR